MVGVYVPGIDEEPDNLAEQTSGPRFLITVQLALHLAEMLEGTRKWLVVADERGAFTDRNQANFDAILSALANDAAGLRLFSAEAETRWATAGERRRLRSVLTSDLAEAFEERRHDDVARLITQLEELDS